jgi:hypothetical protein
MPHFAVRSLESNMQITVHSLSACLNVGHVEEVLVGPTRERFMLTPLRSRRRLCSNHRPEEGALVSGVSHVSPTTSWPPGSCR